MPCPKCASERFIKNGFLKQRQRYLCQECGFNYSTPHGHGKPKEMKRQALRLYLEGMGFRGIGRILGVSNVAVLKWMNLAADRLRMHLQREMPKQSKKISVMEWDELWHFVRKKSQNSGSGWQWIEKQWP
jgi:transposase-like protein